VSDQRLIDAFCTTPALAAHFSDASVLAAMLDFEAALAVVEGRAGVIPAAAAAAIAAAARDIDPAAIDVDAFIADARRSATPSIPLVSLLVERVRRVDPAAAAYVHWGATSQDVADTAIVLLLTRARPVLDADYTALTNDLTRLSDGHASTVMLGRTLMQPATPITFGLKAAVWSSNVWDGWSRLRAAIDAAATVQLGGASGSRAALGQDGRRIGVALAAELGLGEDAAPWHTRRGRLAHVAGTCAILSGALGKIARDVALLAQAEVGEVAVAGGGSSTMPQKRNPSGCAVALAASARVPGFVSSLLAGLVQEHERALGGWQLEWSALSDTVQATGAALAAVRETIASLEVFPDRMRANLDATGGTIFAERASLLLRAAVGRDGAETIVSRALARCRQPGVTFPAALAADADAVHALGAGRLSTLDRLDDDVAAAEQTRRELLHRS
jgi:3-carboxy-cis,cis-muconate cycloisomerase